MYGKFEFELVELNFHWNFIVKVKYSRRKEIAGNNYYISCEIVKVSVTV